MPGRACPGPALIPGVINQCSNRFLRAHTTTVGTHRAHTSQRTRACAYRGLRPHRCHTLACFASSFSTRPRILRRCPCSLNNDTECTRCAHTPIQFAPRAHTPNCPGLQTTLHRTYQTQPCSRRAMRGREALSTCVIDVLRPGRTRMRGFGLRSCSTLQAAYWCARYTHSEC